MSAPPDPRRAPSLRLERRLLREGATLVGGVDEVGRGALSGPVSVGIVVVADSHRALAGVRDSKLLTAQARGALVPRIRSWAADWSVGHAAPGEIDELGIVAALRLAALRALAQLERGPDVVILDGKHDWLSGPSQESLFGDDLTEEPKVGVPSVITLVKADVQCTSVAAASVLAKVERDAIMTDLHEGSPHYGWVENKGYAAPDHMDALRRHGPTVHHRRSWRLPG